MIVQSRVELVLHGKRANEWPLSPWRFKDQNDPDLAMRVDTAAELSISDLLTIILGMAGSCPGQRLLNR